jgi:hypothetical protein
MPPFYEATGREASGAGNEDYAGREESHCIERRERDQEGGILQPYSATDFALLSGSLSLCALCGKNLPCQGNVGLVFDTTHGET